VIQRCHRQRDDAHGEGGQSGEDGVGESQSRAKVEESALPAWRALLNLYHQMLEIPNPKLARSERQA
jgi:hypothetical protein